MDMEERVRDVLVAELERQAEESAGALTVSRDAEALVVNGRMDLETLAMAIVGALAGGP